MSNQVHLSESTMLDELKAACDAAGSANKWCEANKISKPFLYEILKGSRPVPDSVACKLGYAREITYRPLYKGQEDAAK